MKLPIYSIRYNAFGSEVLNLPNASYQGYIGGIVTISKL